MLAAPPRCGAQVRSPSRCRVWGRRSLEGGGGETHAGGVGAVALVADGAFTYDAAVDVAVRRKRVSEGAGLQGPCRTVSRRSGGGR